MTIIDRVGETFVPLFGSEAPFRGTCNLSRILIDSLRHFAYSALAWEEPPPFTWRARTSRHMGSSSEDKMMHDSRVSGALEAQVYH